MRDPLKGRLKELQEDLTDPSYTSADETIFDMLYLLSQGNHMGAYVRGHNWLAALSLRTNFDDGNANAVPPDT